MGWVSRGRILAGRWLQGWPDFTEIRLFAVFFTIKDRISHIIYRKSEKINFVV